MAYLSKMSFAVAHNLSHMTKVVLVIFRRILGRVLLKDADDIATSDHE